MLVTFIRQCHKAAFVPGQSKKVKPQRGCAGPDMKNTALVTMLKNEKKLAHLVCCTCPEGCYRRPIPQAMYYRDC